MTDQKPTGVFVRLPLSVADAATFKIKLNDTRVVSESLLVIGTPVTGGELEVFDIVDAAMGGSDAKYVRQPEAQTQIAAREAEIVRLREALVAARDAITSDLNAKSIVCTVWVGPAETLVDYIDAVLEGGAA